ncbi:MAG: V-type ATP synthase subunit B, partial [Candidatus Aenigmarchaeota archaeon]|nr:V-type ATP synthase subunit B [Candidatus Aenigmarchaeota archaeon]
MSYKEYKTIKNIKGNLLFVEKTHLVSYGEIVKIKVGKDDIRLGQVLDTSKDLVVIQSF